MPVGPPSSDLGSDNTRGKVDDVRESAVRSQSDDSRFAKALREVRNMSSAGFDPPRRGSEPLKLTAIDRRFHRVAAAIAKNPSQFRSRLTWTVSLDRDGKPILPDKVQIPNLALVDPRDLQFFFRYGKQAGRVYVILYWRVSSDEQAVHGSSLTAMFRWLLRKCADAGVTIAGIAIDVESGTVERRPALEEVEKWIHADWVPCLVVPTISRLDRNEAHFVARMQRLAARESWVCYGRTYEDPHFDYIAWHDFESRDGAVKQARTAERELSAMKDSMLSSVRVILEEGALFAPNKHDTFCLYSIEPVLRNGRTRRLMVPVKDAVSLLHGIMTQVFEGALANDAKALDRIAEQQGLRTGKAIDWEDLVWELRIGWIIGLNRRSPDTADGLTVECSRLMLLPDRERHQDLLAAIEHILALRRRRSRIFSVADEYDEATRAKMASIQAPRGERIAYRLTCDCTPELTRVMPVGSARDAPPGIPQDFVICPKCSARRSGNPDKVRQPRVEDVVRARNLPDSPCLDCGSWARLVVEYEVVRKGHRVVLQRCETCRNADLVRMGPVLSVDEGPSMPPPSSTSPRVRRKSTGNRRRIAQYPPPLTNAQFLGPPTAAPPGVPRKLWMDKLPADEFRHHELSSRAIALRMYDFLVEHGFTYCFTTQHLRAIGMGGTGEYEAAFHHRWNHGQRTLRVSLAQEGIRLRCKQFPGRKAFAFWLERVDDARH